MIKKMKKYYENVINNLKELNIIDDKDKVNEDMDCHDKPKQIIEILENKKVSPSKWVDGSSKRKWMVKE